MSAVELMSGAKSRKWVHQKPTNQPTNQNGCAHEVVLTASFLINSPKIVNYMVEKWCRSVSYTRKRLSRTGNVFLSHLAMRYCLFTALHLNFNDTVPRSIGAKCLRIVFSSFGEKDFQRICIKLTML